MKSKNKVKMIYLPRGPDVADLWVSVESPGTRLLSAQLWEVLKGPPWARASRIEEAGGIWIGHSSTIRGRSGGWDGRVDWLLLGRTMNSWNPTLCLWVPLCVVAGAA